MEPKSPSLDELSSLAQTKVALVLTLTVYFKSPLPPLKEGVTMFVNHFLELYETRLRWYIDFKMSRAKAAIPALVRYPLRWLEDPTQVDKDFGWYAYEAANYRDAPSVLIDGKSDHKPQHYLSYLHVNLPVDSFEDDYEKFVDLVKQWTRGLPVYYGYAGFAFSESLPRAERQANSKYVFAAANRFPGIEVDNPRLTSLQVIDAIKGVNWLTLFHDSFLEKLGGVEKLSARLSREIIFHKLPHGLMLQAGKEPQAGDVNAGDRIPLYREVARALKPIRTKEHPPLGHADEGSFGDQGTLDWLRRFDD